MPQAARLPRRDDRGAATEPASRRRQSNATRWRRRRPTTNSPGSSSRALSGKRAASTRRRSARRARKASRSSCRRPPRCAGSPTPSSRCRRCASRRATCASWHDLPRQPGPGRGGLQCRPRPGRGLARQAQRPSGRDAGLRHDRHGLCRGSLGFEIAAAVGVLGRAALDPGNGRALREIAKSMIERARRRPDLTTSPAWGPWVSSLPATGPKPASSPPTSGCAASTAPSWATACRWSCGRRRGSRALVRVSQRAQAANALCAKLMAAGGALLLRNPRSQTVTSTA